MHRTYPVPRLVRWSLVLGLLVCAGAGASRVGAQEPPTRGVIVPINITKEVPTTGKALIATIKVENPAIVRVNPSVNARSVMLTGLFPGTTKVTLTDKDGAVEALDVVVQSDVQYLRFMLKQAVPTANIEPVPSANNVFILTGTVAKSEDIPVALATAQSVVGAGIINALRVGGVVQVQLDVIIAQVSRSEIREMSFSFINMGQHHFFSSTLNPGLTLNSTNAISPAAVTGLLDNAGSVQNLALGFLNDKQGFLGFLQALRNEGLAKFLAEPRLITTSGKSAHFMSGGQLAVPEPSGLGTNAVAFKDFGTQLTFLPIVLGNGKIYLEVEPRVDNVNAANGTSISGTAVPGFDTQQLHTTVEMEPGQTFAIGGLIQNEVNASTSKVPVLGDIPFLNVFFSSKSFKQQETELLILVTPHLVDPMACNQLPKYLPGQETRNPDDFELFLEGIMEAPRGQRQVFQHGHYTAAYLNSPSAGQYPCGLGAGCGGAGCGNGGCSGPGCGGPGCSSCNGGNWGGQGDAGMAPTAPMAPATPMPMPLPNPRPAAPTSRPALLPTGGRVDQQTRVVPEPTNVEQTGGVDNMDSYPAPGTVANMEQYPPVPPAAISPMGGGR